MAHHTATYKHRKNENETVADTTGSIPFLGEIVQSYNIMEQHRIQGERTVSVKSVEQGFFIVRPRFLQLDFL